VAPLLFIVAFQKVKMDRIEDGSVKAMEAEQFDDFLERVAELDDNPYDDLSWMHGKPSLRNVVLPYHG
jgi:hypothetical protein